MLSNFVVGSHKFVLFVDGAGLERSSQKLIQNLLSEQSVNFAKFDGSFEFSKPTTVLLEPISKMELISDSASIYTTIQMLKLNENVSQVFCWATSKNITDRLLIPFLEHLCNILVTIKSTKHLSILTKRKFGTVRLKQYQHELLQGKTAIVELKISTIKVAPVTIEVDPETVGTFKIGEFNAEELEAKQNLKLPYELMLIPIESELLNRKYMYFLCISSDLPRRNQHKEEGKIIYTHDR